MNSIGISGENGVQVKRLFSFEILVDPDIPSICRLCIGEMMAVNQSIDILIDGEI